MSETPDTQLPATAPGQILKHAREGKNLTVAAIATLMNLDLRTIEALERGDQDKLPAPIFVRGYLRGYARLVGVDEAAVLETYRAHAPQEPIPRAVGLSKVSVRPAFRAPAVPWRGLLWVVVALGAVWLGMQWGPRLIARLTGEGSQETAAVDEAGVPVPDLAQPETREQTAPAGDSVELPIIATPPAESSATQTPTVQTPTVQTPTAQTPEMPAAEQSSTEPGRVDAPLPDARPAAPTEPVSPATESKPELPGDADASTNTVVDSAAGTMQIELRVDSDSWVEVQAADGSKLVLDLLRKGETRSVAGKAPLSVLLGNAAGVELRVDGKLFDHRRYDRDNIARFEIGGKP